MEQQELGLKQARKSRDERVIDACEIARGVGGYWFTLAWLAKRMGLRKSPYLRGIVQELLDSEVLEMRWETTHTQLPVALYKWSGR